MNKMLFKPNRSQLSKHLAMYMIAEKTVTRPQVLAPIIGPQCTTINNSATYNSKIEMHYRSKIPMIIMVLSRINTIKRINQQKINYTHTHTHTYIHTHIHTHTVIHTHTLHLH